MLQGDIKRKYDFILLENLKTECVLPYMGPLIIHITQRR